MKTWILVSDASRARIFEAENIEARWHAVDELRHPDSRKKSSELSPTEPGHAQKSKGSPRHSSFEPHQTPHEVEAQHFAQQLADRLNRGADKRLYEEVVLVAPPPFLGLLRQHLDSDTAKRVRSCIDRDYTGLAERELVEQVRVLAASMPKSQS